MIAFQGLLATYTQILEKESVNSELYKWEAIQHFQENWKSDCPDDDFFEMFKRAFAKRSNLFFQNSYGFLSKLAEQMPKEAKALIEYLFQDEIPLEQRIPIYQEKSSNLLLELRQRLGKDNINHQQDERTISFLLTLHNPEKYFLYKDNVYKWLCESKGVQPREAGKKYFHFVELAQNDLEIIRNDSTLQGETRKFIPSTFKFDSTNLIFQDIYYRTMPRTKEMRKDYFIELCSEVKNYLQEENHPIAKQYWTEPKATYSWISIWRTDLPDPYFLHYEIILLKNEIVIELHPEGSPQFKMAFEPFMNQIDSSKYSTRVWHHGLAKGVKQNYQKIISKTKGSDYNNESEPTEGQVKAISAKLMEFYNDFQVKIEHYLKEINFPFTPTIKDTKMKTPLNQILYGPPGTGKTYSTIDKVVEICDEDYQEGNHSHNKTIYDRLVKDGRVVFTTFHQSMSYEDFIEGIKPLKPGEEDTFLKYDIEPGIFKQIANTAKTIKSAKSNVIDWDTVNYFKMSIGGKNRPDIHNWCIENSVVGIGWGGEEDLSSLVAFAKSNNWIQYRDKFKELYPETVSANRYHIQASFIFNKMKIGDVVVISKGNHIIDAIGKITGDYQFNDQTPTDMFHFRKVEWIATDLDASPEKFIDKQISQQSIYEFYNDDVKKGTFKSLTQGSQENTNPYVIIIDEINRGNVSAIFGELITLIEDDKRIDEPNEVKITLPYSKDKFGVPANLYILGTMNTADRSVEALDTALRRRFAFTEMLPQPELLSRSAMLTRLMWKYEDVDWKDNKYLEKENSLRSFFGQIDDDEWKSRIKIWDTQMKGKDSSILSYFEHFHFHGYDLQELLETINKRIEVLVDRDHTIGHAYLMDVDSEATLKFAFKNKIIPLLQEYFYGNYEKMEMVIGSAFFEDLTTDQISFARGNYEFNEPTKRYKLKPIDAKFNIKNAIDLLLNKNKSVDN